MTDTRPSAPASALDVATLGISAILLGLGLWVFFAGPTGLMPIHFNVHGDADDWAGRETIGALILALGALLLILSGGMGWFARRAGDPGRARSLRFGQLVVLLSLTGVTLFVASLSLSGATSIGTVLPMAGLSAILMLTGAFLGRVGPNPIVGVRTPWAFKSKLAWERSNRLAGRLLFLIGLFGLVSAPLMPQPFGVIAVVVAVVAAAIASAVESWRVWRSDPDRQPF
ncbi:MAG: SdpI family protein [Brevundimonas sp.]|uniref:SdpI family protein n=1 Tax=Brevundimonas sp. TaxID=1871086 RepID=UPI0027335A69|nr:SdpI family protein [Brevundimonas sp.]MDP3378926.1 SdpI family protein [Brevundimonas sp.]